MTLTRWGDWSRLRARRVGARGGRREGARVLTKAADSGEADAQCRLGIAYANGEFGLEASGAEALEYYTKAAGGGDADAQCRLGMAYANGKFGLEASGAKALEYYTKAAGGGDADAQCRLGMAYANGELSRGRRRGGARVLHEGRGQRHARAAAFGMAYEFGKLGLEVDGAKALEYYTKAATAGDADGSAGSAWPTRTAS